MTSPTRRTQVVRSGVVVAVSMAVMNVATYVFNIVASPLLGPRDYGAVAAILSVLAVLNVIALGLQATTARRIAAEPEAAARIQAEMLRISWRTSLLVGGLCLLAAPLLERALQLDSLLTACLIGVAATPLTHMGGQAGVLQGRSAWRRLSLIYLGFGLGRLLAGAACILVRPDALSATLGVAIGAFAPAAMGWVAINHRTPATAPEPREHASMGSVLREFAASSHALLAFLCLCNVDMVVSRVVMSSHQSGLYAAGLIVTKAVLFLPQFIVVVLFPAMSREVGPGRLPWAGLGLVAGTGLLSTTAVALLSRIDATGDGVSAAVLLVGGAEYTAIGSHLWLWAALGGVLALVQVLIYAGVATRRTDTTGILWTGLAVIAVTGPFVAGPIGLLNVVVFVDAVVLAALVAVHLVMASVRRGVPAGAGADRHVERDGQVGR